MKEELGEVETQFQTIFMFSPTSVVLMNKEGRVVESNTAFQNLFGYTQAELQNLSFTELIHPDDRVQSVKLFQEMLAGKKTHFTQEDRYLHKDGCVIWGNISANAVCDTDGSPHYAIATLQNITDTKQVELDLQDTQTLLKKQVPKQTAELVQIKSLLKQEIAERQKTQDALKIQQEFLQTLINIYPHTVFAKGSFAVVTDATTLEAMESELQQTKEQLRAVLDAVPGCVCWVNSEGRYLGVNQYMANTFNLSPDEFIGKELSFLENSPEFTEFLTQFLASSAQTDHREIESRVNGSPRYYLIATQKYYQGSLAVSVGIDITERKQAEAKIQASLREKEVLLQEIHHRVKNNLQVISSLLDLQSQQIEEQVMLEAFRESQNRVKSMALVHEKLYQSQDFSRIDFAEYTRSLTNYLFKAYELNSERITLDVLINEQISLNIDTAIPCGLIINELVSNSLKHAFPDNRAGTISVALYAEDGKRFSLSIEDNGVGFPENFNLKTVQSLGIQIVNVLVKQIKGRIELDQTSGSKFRVSFSEVNPHNDIN